MDRSLVISCRAFLVTQMLKNLSASAEDARDSGSIPRLGKPPGEGNSYPVQYSCLKNSMDRGTWQATVLRVTKRQTWLSNTNTIYYRMTSLKDIFNFPSFSVSSYLVEGILPLFKSWMKCKLSHWRDQILFLRYLESKGPGTWPSISQENGITYNTEPWGGHEVLRYEDKGLSFNKFSRGNFH